MALDQTEVTATPADTDNSPNTPSVPSKGIVTFRGFIVGLLLCAFVAALNCWMETVYNVHMIGGIQMPFVALFVLLILIVGVNVALRVLKNVPGFKPFSVTELMTTYAMMVFGALLSTPGCDNVFLTTGPTLFYYQTPENKWASLFYHFIPSWFAPGWDGVRFQHEVIDPLYLGGLHFSQIPWHAWTAMLIAWSIFMGFCYALMFFTALLFRKQWIEREALAFPLVEVPLQMVEIEKEGQNPPTAAFWGNRLMWLGFGLALFFHFFKGMNSIWPDWPIFPVNSFGNVSISFPDQPWNAIPTVTASVYLGGIGIAYLLTREISFSFWFFFIVYLLEYAVAGMLGFPIAGMHKSGVGSHPDFLIYQSVGGWLMMGLLLFWTAREYLFRVGKAAFTNNRTDADEPFSARFMVFGFIISFAGLIGWSWFAGINVFIALIFFGIYLLTSLVLTRTVIEGGFMFPQPPFLALETMMGSGLGYNAVGAANLTKLSFIQPSIMVDMRTNILPAFLHVMKISKEVGLDKRNLRRMLWCCVAAVVVAFAVTIVASIYALYSTGGLQAYSWFSNGAAQNSLKSTASAITTGYPVDPGNILWIVIGAALVLLMMAARSRFLWFPFNPLGYLVAAAFPITNLWFSFFLGWAIKSLIMKYGGSDTYARVRPFMIGLILGNAMAMMLWMFIGLYTGAPIKYWPA